MGSTRFPGKMLETLGGITLFEWMARRAMKVGYPVFLSTSTAQRDQVLADSAMSLGLGVHRGEETDVLGRALGCATQFRLLAFARLCGDRPFFDIEEMRDGLQRMSRSLNESRCPAMDLVSNNVSMSPPPGLTTEIVNTEALRRADVLATQPDEREHVTSFFYAHPGAFSINALPSRHHDLRGQNFAVDHPDDLRRFQFLVGDAEPDQLTAAEVAAMLSQPGQGTPASMNAPGQKTPASACCEGSGPMRTSAGELERPSGSAADPDLLQRTRAKP